MTKTGKFTEDVKRKTVGKKNTFFFSFNHIGPDSPYFGSI